MMRRTFRSGTLALLFSGAVVAWAGSAFAQELRIYYDQYGRRVLVDEMTGEIVRIGRPSARQLRRYLREQRVMREAEQDPYALQEYPGAEEEYSSRRAEAEDYGRLQRRHSELLPEEQEDFYGEFPPPPPRGDEEPAYSREFGNPLGDDQPAARDPQVTASVGAMARPSPIVPAAPTKDKKELAAVQVLLDRAGASPGVIDGRWGQNMAQAVEAYKEITGKTLNPGDAAAVEAELQQTGGPAMMSYTITEADVAGPYVAAIPVDYAEKARLPAMSYTSPAEMLAERFHMDETFLKALNPKADFSRPGTVITVANTGQNVTRKVTRILADKAKEQVRAYDDTGALVAAYPSTIGSSDTPSPSGTVQVERIAHDPNYTYNPKINFKQGANDKILTIPPGPNGPVGSIWIALSKPTYGIHGTPDPSQIGKTNSHGCVRLTNWDASELAKLVSKGATVEFVD